MDGNDSSHEGPASRPAGADALTSTRRMITLSSGKNQQTSSSSSSTRPYRWVCGVVVLSGLAILVAVWVPNLGQGMDGLRLDIWIRAQQSLSYEHEFVSRGLFGEVVRLTGYPNRELPMFFLSVAIYLGLACLLGGLAWRAFSSLDDRPRLVATVLVLSLPFSLPNLAFDLGRSDTLLYAAVVPVILWPRLRRMPLAAYLVLGGAGVLVHQLFVLVHVPLLVFTLATETEGGPRRVIYDRRAAALVVGSLIGLGAVLLEGQMTSVPEEQLAAELEAALPDYDGEWNPEETRLWMLPAHHVLYLDTRSQVEGTLESLATGRPILYAVVAAVPLALLLWALRRGGETALLRRLPVALAPCALLFLAGFDTTRWVALASFNALLATLVHFTAAPPDLQAWRRARLPLALLASTVALGPMGVNVAFPMWLGITRHLGLL